MAFNHLLYYSVILCWAINIYFLACFALDWQEREPEKLKSWLAIASLAALAAGVTFFLPARGGYDNNHDFLCLGQKFFTKDPFILLHFKELSPLFTDAVSDILSGYSLSALLWKNRLLQVFSIFVFFTGLRRLGLSLAVSAASAAFLFLNFLSPLNASSFSTTSSNIFIWLVSLLAIFDAYASASPGPGALVWIISSLVLVMSARFEFFPVNLLLIAAFVAAKYLKGNRFILKPGNLAAIAAGACITWAWAAHSLAFHPARQIGTGLRPFYSLAYQLGARNLGTIAGVAPGWPGGREVSPAPFFSPSAILCWLFILAALAGLLAGCRADKQGAKVRLAAGAAVLLWIGYFSVIFLPLDFYPLHFMRHQLYFFVPFAFLFTLGLDGFERAFAGAPAPRRRLLRASGLLALAAYAALNAKAALGFNRELRTNDRELAFLMQAQRSWPAGCLVLHPVRNNQNARADLIKKYFPTPPDCREAAAACLLKYVSPEPAIFSDSEADPLEQAPLAAGKAGAAWQELSFPHAFYTAFAGRVTETTDPVPLTIGFFSLEKTGRDQALLETLAGTCAFDSGDFTGAALKFRSAVAADPSCLNARYFLSLSYALERKKDAALAELAKIENVSRRKLSPQRRALTEILALGETEKASGLALEISNERPDFFFRKNFSRSIYDPSRERQRP